MGDGHPFKAVGFVYGCEKRLIANDAKPRKTDRGSLFDEDFDLVGSVGNLLIYKSDRLFRAGDKGKTEE